MNDDDLIEEFYALIDFARGSKVPTGFGYMDEDGVVDPSRPVELWISARMTHVFALATMISVKGAREQMDHGVQSLLRYFRDHDNGGWYSSIEAEPDPKGRGIPANDAKEAYAQAFVILAASSAVAAGSQEARALLDTALAEQMEHWHDPETGMVSESWDRTFTHAEKYRGINANMHTVEAELAASDVLGDIELLERATRVLRFVYDQAWPMSWRIPEHYTTDWEVIADYNKDQPAHPFRPYGVTPGHAFEWSRLMLHARGSRIAAGLTVGDWMLDGARALFESAVSDAWAVDGADGFVYTTDFDGNPVVRARMHWVLCEAIGAAVVLAKTLEAEGESTAELHEQIRQWWHYALENLIVAPGQWNHELDATNTKSTQTWAGKPDVYHAVQMTLLPIVGATPTFAAALSRGRAELRNPPQTQR